MTNTIELFEPRATTPFHTVTASTLTLTFDEDGAAWYEGATASTEVEFVLAYLDASQLELTMTPQAGVGALRVGDIDGTPSPHTSGAPVTAGVSWTSGAGGVLAMIFTTPTVQYDQFDWTIGEGVPPVRLTVKIRRR